MSIIHCDIGGAIEHPHGVEIDRNVVIAFWRLGRALSSDHARDREVFALGRSIGNTSGTTASLHAFGERDDPSSFALSKLIYGGDKPMLDAYWQTVDGDPIVFLLARRVFESCTSEPRAGAASSGGAELIFDVGGDQARLAGIRFTA
jgi:hypothetical protein